MMPALKLAWLLAAIAGSLEILCAQDLAPRAYVITPIHSNAVVLTYSYFNGSLVFNGAAPIKDATGTYSVEIFNYYHSFRFFGRSANFNGSLPYGIGTFQGDVSGQHKQVYRSGLIDSVYRVSVNLIGGPAIAPPEFVKWKQKTLLGASLKVVAPTGQYDPTKLVNWGSNRWVFKPEVGYSRRWGNWLLDGYGGVWLYTTNSHFFSLPSPKPQTQSPIGSFEGHLSYDAKPRLWFSLDGNYWFGGETSLNGVVSPSTSQRSSRIGITASVPLTRHQSVKFSYSKGTYVRFGGDYHNVSVGWQYSWLGRPK